MNQEKEEKRILMLEAVGYTLVMEVLPTGTSQIFKVKATLRTKLPESDYEIIGKTLPVEFDEIHSFGQYLSEHATKIHQNSYTRSDTYLDYGMLFQATALEGGVNKETGLSHYTLEILINVGFPIERGGRVYLGGSSQVYENEIDSFVQQIEQLREMNNGDQQ